MIYLSCKSATLCVLTLRWLPCHVSDQLLNLFFWSISMRFVQEVCSHKRADFDHWMRKESLEEMAQVLASLLQECCLHITYIFLLREAWCTLSASDMSLDLVLKLSQGWVSIPQMESNVFARHHNFDYILSVTLSRDFVLHNVDAVLNGVDNFFRIHFSLFLRKIH